MPVPSLGLSADYAEALLAAKRVKNFLFVIVLLLLLSDLSLFFVARYTAVLNDVTSGPASQLRYAVGMIDFLGLILPALLTVVIYLMLKVQLVGRLLGAGKMTRAFLWSTLLIFLLFPWQSVLNNPAISGNAALNATGAKVPGVLFTWSEFVTPPLSPKFDSTLDPASILHWARYVGFPGLAVLLLLVVQANSSRSLREAMVAELPRFDSPAAV